MIFKAMLCLAQKSASEHTEHKTLLQHLSMLLRVLSSQGNRSPTELTETRTDPPSSALGLHVLRDGCANQTQSSMSLYIVHDLLYLLDYFIIIVLRLLRQDLPSLA